MDKMTLLARLQTAHNAYFQLFLEHFPSHSPADEPFKFGPSRLYELATDVHACAIALGPSAFERLCLLGLDQLYPFDNPVDLYTWRQRVRERQVPHAGYASMAIRIDAELQRLRQVLELGGEAAFQALPAGTFLVSKARYNLAGLMDWQDHGTTAVAETTTPETGPPDAAATEPAADHRAVGLLERLESATSIGANSAALISTLIKYGRHLF